MKICFPCIALDLDGTLLNSKKQISFTDYYAIRLFVSLGGRVLLASGRSPISTEWIAENLGVDKCLVAFNGSFVQKQEDNEYRYIESTFSEDEISYLLNLVENMGLEYILYERDTIRIKQETPLNKRWLSELLNFDYLNTNANYEEYNRKLRLIKGDNATQKMSDILKLVILPNNIIEFRNVFCALQDKGFSLNKTVRYIEITKKSYDKRFGISKILEDVEYSISDIMAIGDNYNDISMLKSAKLGVSVDNSSVEIKRVADMVTSSNDNNGVAEAILKYAIK